MFETGVGSTGVFPMTFTVTFAFLFIGQDRDLHVATPLARRTTLICIGSRMRNSRLDQHLGWDGAAWVRWLTGATARFVTAGFPTQYIPQRPGAYAPPPNDVDQPSLKVIPPLLSFSCRKRSQS
jgi:hypothetical protein